LTEHENRIWTVQEWALMEEIAGVDIARVDNDGVIDSKFGVTDRQTERDREILSTKYVHQPVTQQ